MPFRMRALAALSAISISGSLHAQVRVRGLVYDSLLGGPLPGATVWLRDFDRNAVTDSAGRFVMDGVPPGPHLFLVSHPDLDSAGLGTIAAQVTVARGEAVTLATPSIATVWRRLCSRDSIGPDSGIVFGSVRDVDSRDLLSGVTVTVEWPHLTLATLRRDGVETRIDSTTTDSTGTYRVCGVATGLNLRAQAHAGSYVTGIVQLMAPDRPVARQDLSLSRVPAGDSGRGSTALRGAVRTAARPLAGAVITLDGVDSAVTDAGGRFVLDRLPGGTQWLRARAVGFAPRETAIDLPGSGVDTVELVLQEITILDTISVVVTGREAWVLRDLEERRKVGFGYSLGPAEIQKRPTVTSVLRSFPSLFVQTRAGAFTVIMRSGDVMRPYCVADLRLDGLPATWDQLSVYQPEELLAVEVYPRPSLAPLQYRSISSGCGLVLVWTKYLQ